MLVSPHLYVYDLAVLPVVFLTVSSRWLKGIAAVWFLLPPLLYLISFPYLMWFAPAVIVPLLLLAVCLFQPGQSDDASNLLEPRPAQVSA